VFLESELKFEAYKMTIKKLSILFIALVLPFALISCSDDPVRIIDVDNGNGDNGNGDNGSDAVIEFPITFEEDIPWDNFITNFDGGDLSVVDNPDKSGINTSDKAARMIKGEGQPWGGAFLQLAESIDFTGGTDFTVSVWAPRENTRMLFKIENDEDPGLAFEREITIEESQEWVDITFNLANADQSIAYQRLVVIFNNGTVGDGSADFTWYFDNIRQSESDDDGNGNGGDAEALTLPVTFDDDNINYGLTDFGGNQSEIVTDPTNGTNKVVQTIKTVDAEVWAGTTVGGTVGFADPIPFTSSETTMSVRVWSPTADTPIRLKVEDSNDPTISVETETNTTVAQEWETLVFDFSNEADGTAALNLSSSYNKASIFFNFGTTGAAAGEQTYFWDDVDFGGEADNGNGNGNGGEPDGDNLIINGDFADGLAPWSTFIADFAGVSANIAVVDGEATITNISGAGGEVWHIQLNQILSGAQINALEIGATYKVEFEARAAAARQLKLFFGEDGGGFVALNESNFDLTTSMETYEAVFEVGQTFGDMKLGFEMGLSNVDVFIDNVSMKKTDDNGNGNGNGNGGETGLNQPIDFEAGGFGADWTWTVFENASNPALEIIANPDKSAPNTSDTVARFTALEAGGAFAGFETVEGQLGEFLFTVDNCLVAVDVWKSVETNVSVKFDTGAPPNDWGTALVTSANSETEQWETLTFNFCEVSPELRNPNPADGFGGLKRIAIFPDNEERNQDNVIYIDNITFSAQ